MALTKKEQEYIEGLKTRIALNWTPKVQPDVPIPTTQGLSVGFLFRAGTMEVAPSCSSSTFHAFGQTDRTTSQYAMPLYSTRKRALMAMRNELELEFAKKLRAIDRQIEAEENKAGAE